MQKSINDYMSKVIVSSILTFDSIISGSGVQVPPLPPPHFVDIDAEKLNQPRFQRTVSRKYKRAQYADVLELVDNFDLESKVERRAGSSPVIRTKWNT